MKKADLEAGVVTVRKRYYPGREESVLEIVKRRPALKEITFWICTCGIRMHTDILVCTDCGRHRHHDRNLPAEPKPEPEKCDKAFEELKKELEGLCKEIKSLKGGKENKPEKEPEPSKPPPPPNPTPCLPQYPFIPLIPAPYLAEPPKPPPEEPKPTPRPSPKPDLPQPQPPIVIVNVPECSERSRERPQRRCRDPSPSSSCSEVSVGSFQRVRRHVNVLGRRLWNLEDREAVRDEEGRREAMDELRFRREADERRRLIDVEGRGRRRAIEELGRDKLASRERRELERERERDREAKWELDRERRDLSRQEDREQARERAFWQRREIEWVPTYSPEVRFSWRRGLGPYVERWEGKRRLVD